MTPLSRAAELTRESRVVIARKLGLQVKRYTLVRGVRRTLH